MKYNYKPEQIPISSVSKRMKVVWRPIIPIILIKDKFILGYEALIDSGADNNVFHADLARILGIKLTSGKSRKIYGLSGESIKGYIHNIDIKPIGMKSIKVPVIFSNQIPPHSLGVLGNQGFFDRFIVEFNYEKKTVEVK